MKFLVLNGPNINMLGIRQPEIYGRRTLRDIEQMMLETCEENNIQPTFFQSNHEGALVDAIQGAYGKFDGIIINPAAYTHTSIAILDALKAVGIPAAEVHISDIHQREEFRHVSYAGMACVLHYIGLGEDGYRQAIIGLKKYIEEKEI